MESDQVFLESVVKALVDKPDAVSVQRDVDEMGVLLTLKVDPADMGQIIGRQGQTARAIRTLLRVVGAKNNARVNLKIYEPEGSQRPRRDESPREEAPKEAAAPAEEVTASDVDDLKL
ncbi:MAG: KH domain-containing protein [Candidatus Komeilibacteria bacterium]